MREAPCGPDRRGGEGHAGRNRRRGGRAGGSIKCSGSAGEASGAAQARNLTPEQRRKLLRRRLLAVGKQVTLGGRRKRLFDVLIYQASFDATHENIRLHGWISEPETVGSRLTSSFQDTASSLSEIRKHICKVGDLCGLVRNA